MISGKRTSHNALDGSFPVPDTGSHTSMYVHKHVLLPNGAGIDWDKVIFKGRFLKGIYGREMFETWYKMQTMLLSGLDICPVITHRFSFDDFQAGFDAMLSGQSGKVVLGLD